MYVMSIISILLSICSTNICRALMWHQQIKFLMRDSKVRKLSENLDVMMRILFVCCSSEFFYNSMSKEAILLLTHHIVIVMINCCLFGLFKVSLITS